MAVEALSISALHSIVFQPRLAGSISVLVVTSLFVCGDVLGGVGMFDCRSDTLIPLSILSGTHLRVRVSVYIEFGCLG